MATTFVQIGNTVTVGTTAVGSIDFTSIPNTYTDLQILLSARGSGTGGDTLYVQFNGDTGAFYAGKRLFGNATSPISDNWTAAANGALTIAIPGTGSTASMFSSHTIYIPNYKSAYNKHISIDGVRENNAASTYIDTGMSNSTWVNTATITSISLKLYLGTNFTQYTTATLYGIKNS